ncbi:hypothetical protein J14TS5_15740 [Paenibacillus lautus]|nr:hypothetical protein J14TS5_15740 [Paenibacillus lautus]
MLYKSVAESERFQHSERLALCQYRLFMLELGDDQDANLQAAVYFEPYVDRLDEMYQLDALKELVNLNLSLHRWDKVDAIALKMGTKATIQYQHIGKIFKKQEGRNKPLIFYILYSHLIRATVCYECGDYEKALEFVTLYEDPTWIDDPDYEEIRVIEQFKEWAEANKYLYKLMAGDDDLLVDYVDFITDREDEIFLGLCSIMIAANRYQLDVDYILDKFKKYIVHKEQRNHIGKIIQQVTADRYTRLLAELGIYYLNTNRYESGLEFILDSLENSIKINSDKGMLRCMGVFEQFRPYSTNDLQLKYKYLVKDVQILNNKKIGTSIGYR